MAMLWHLGIASDEDDFPHCPVIVPDSVGFTYASCTFFGQSMDESDLKEPLKEHDDKKMSPLLQCNAITNHGRLRFCEATKVDLSS